MDFKKFDEEVTAGFPHLEISEVHQTCYGGVDVAWACENVGFGHLGIYWDDGKLHIDPEGMSKNFYLAVMDKLTDFAVIDGI